MDFQLNQEQKLWQEQVFRLAQVQLAPRAAEYDRTGRFPWENIRKLAEHNMMGIPVPKTLGGAGRDSLSYVIAIEEISRACAATGLIVAVHTSVGTLPILTFGTPEQQEKYGINLAQGKILGAFALTEPQAGSDAAGICTSAVDRGDHFVLNGTKVFITNGSQADTYLTFAVTDKAKGPHGISAFIVEKDTPGFAIGTIERKLGLNASATAELIFTDAIIPKENLLGELGQGFKIAMANLDYGRIGIGAQGLGIAQAALTVVLDYLKELGQAGLFPSHQALIQQKLADMDTAVEAARLLVYRAANLKDKGLSFVKEAAMAKMFAADTAMKVTAEAMQILGAEGATGKYAVERLFRDAKATQIYEGTNEIQRLVIARQLLK